MATNDSYIPAEYNTGIVRGDFFEEKFTFTIDGDPIDLTGCDVRIQIKDLSNRSQFPVYLSEFVIEPDVYVITGIKLEDTNTLIWTINDVDTKTFPPGSYQYDLEIEIGGKTRTFIKGQFQVERDITV